MPHKATIRALISRGVDSHTAERLSEEKHTLKSLSQMKSDDLRELGLSDAIISSIHSDRPPIPEETVILLTSLQRRFCCICRAPDRPYIIHHIVPWKESHSHNIDNLALLCLNCHSDVHSTHDLSQNLTPERVTALKKDWLEQVRLHDEEIMKSDKLCGMISPAWDYFNHNRIIDLSQRKEVDRDYDEFFASGRASQYLYSGTPRTGSPYLAFEKKLYEILRKHPYHHLNNQSTTAEISTLARSGNLIILTANHVFKPHLDSVRVGPGQECLGYYTRNRNRISFTFDLWETTSLSAYSHLKGQWLVSSVLVIDSVSRKNVGIDIQARCLAIGEGIVDYQGNPWPDIAYRNEEREREEEEAKG